MFEQLVISMDITFWQLYIWSCALDLELFGGSPMVHTSTQSRRHLCNESLVSFPDLPRDLGMRISPIAITNQPLCDRVIMIMSRPWQIMLKTFCYAKKCNCYILECDVLMYYAQIMLNLSLRSIFQSTPHGVLTAHTEWLPGVQLRHFSPTCAVHIEDCEGWWLS